MNRTMSARRSASRLVRARQNLVEQLGFDWISLSEHHYSPRILTPSPVVSATWLAARTQKIKIAMLGPIVPVSNPIRIAEEMAMLDTLAPGRIIVGLLQKMTNEYLSYDLNPKEARERTDEGIEPRTLKAWTEPQPFGWQGRHFQYRTVSIWPRSQHQPHPPTYALGTSAEAGEFAARHRLGLGVSYGTFELMAAATRHYREACARYGWEPRPDDIIYRANMILGETDDAAEETLSWRDKQAAFPACAPLCAMRCWRPIRGMWRVSDDRRMLGAYCRSASAVVPTAPTRHPCREEIGAGVIDLSLLDPGVGDTAGMMRSLELFGQEVLPRIREI